MTAGLELRYRRLLSLFPAQHRRIYEEEMIGVLLAAADPHQRRPRAGEAFNLIVTGLRLRLGRWGRFGGFAASSPRFDPPVLLAPVQWVVLVVVPLVTLVAGSTVVQALDRRAYLINLGRAAEQETALDPDAS